MASVLVNIIHHFIAFNASVKPDMIQTRKLLWDTCFMFYPAHQSLVLLLDNKQLTTSEKIRVRQLFGVRLYFTRTS